MNNTRRVTDCIAKGVGKTGQPCHVVHGSIALQV
jgi:hypothetical protein